MGTPEHRRCRAAATTAIAGIVLILPGCASPAETSEQVTSAPSRIWDPDSWEPTVKVTARTFTEEERWAARAEALKAKEPTTGPVPQVEFIRWTNSVDDYSRTISTCLNDAGFPQVSPGITGPDLGEGVPEEQFEVFELANYRCEAQYSLDPRYSGDWSEDQIGLVHDYFEQYYIPCMRAHGQPVVEEGKPTRDVYIATFFTTEERWWPYPAVEVPADVAKACPTLPPDTALYGG